MKRIFTLLSICALVALSFQVNAQCTPDESLMSTGVTPTELDFACEGRAYTDTLSVGIESSILLPPVGALSLDSVVINSIAGLPLGADYDCHNANCTIINRGGAMMYGCIRLFGTPEEFGQFPLTISYTAYAIGQAFPSTISSQVSVLNKNDIACVVSGVDNAIEDAIVYPNPATSEVYFNEAVDQATIYNLSGSKVLEQSNVEKVDVSNLPSGMYMISVDGATQRLQVK